MIKLIDILKEMAISKEIYAQIKPTDRIIMSHEPEINPEFRLQPEMDFKPKGLWYAIGTEWYDWVEKNMPKWLDNYNFAYRLELNPGSVIKLGEDISWNDFEDLYGIRRKNDYIDTVAYINWFKVQFDAKDGFFGPNKYGIEIIDPWGKAGSWERTWDISSGCIWDPKAIKSITKIVLD